MIEVQDDKSSMKTCPFCAEKIQLAAIKCRYCGESLAVEGSSGGENPKPQIQNSEKRRFEPLFDPVKTPKNQTGGGSSTGQAVGGLAFLAGLYLFFEGFSMKTSVSTGMGEVVNLSLMDQANTYKMSGGFLVLIGLAFAAYSSQANASKSS